MFEKFRVPCSAFRVLCSWIFSVFQPTTYYLLLTPCLLRLTPFSQCGNNNMLLFIRSTKISGGFKPRYAAPPIRINWDTDLQGLTVGTVDSSKFTAGINSILNLFFANAQIISVSNNNTTNRRTSWFDSKSDLNIRNSLTNIPDGGMAVTLINASSTTMAPVVLYLK